MFLGAVSLSHTHSALPWPNCLNVRLIDVYFQSEPSAACSSASPCAKLTTAHMCICVCDPGTSHK